MKTETKEVFDKAEMSRVKALAALDLDYQQLEEEFEHLTRLAARIANTEISLINLIDTYTQWTISNHNLDLGQMPREESICTYTIREKDSFEVKRLDRDERFVEKSYVKGENGARYYFGLPLRIGAGEPVGALCVISRSEKELAEEQIHQLKLLAVEIEKRLQLFVAQSKTEQKAARALKARKRLAHDIRGAVSGIVGLSKLSSEEDPTREEMKYFLEMIGDSGRNVLQLTEEILTEARKTEDTAEGIITLKEFGERLEGLYRPQAVSKSVNLETNFDPDSADIKFPRKHLLPIAGNLVCNAIKFTPPGRQVKVDLQVTEEFPREKLRIEVRDNGIGMPEEKLKGFRKGFTESEIGTLGEKGFGFGLQLVSELLEDLDGDISISSNPGKGTRVSVAIPLVKLD